MNSNAFTHHEAIGEAFLRRFSHPACYAGRVLGALLLLLPVLVFPALWGQTSAPENKSQASHTETLENQEKQQRAALALHPQSLEFHGELGRTLVRAGKYEEATQELGIVVNQIPDSRLYNMALVEALLGWRHWGVAAELLHAIRQRFGQYPEFHYYLGLTNFQLNKIKEALPEFEEALRLDPKLDQAKYGVAACKAAIGDLQGAAALSRMLVKEHPRNARYWLALAQVLDSMGETEGMEALDASRRALALLPGDATIELKRAVILTRLKRYSEARPLLEHVVKREPQNLQAHVTLASIYSRLGQRELAQKESKIVVQLEKSKSEHLETPLPMSP